MYFYRFLLLDIPFSLPSLFVFLLPIVLQVLLFEHYKLLPLLLVLQLLQHHQEML
jgi:hypothetical protein